MFGKVGAVLAVLFVLILASCGREGGKLDNRDPFKESPKQSSIAPKVLQSPAAGPYCHPDSSGKYPDDFTIGEKGMKGNHAYADGGGCILRPLREVWAVSHNPDTWRWKKSDMSNFRLIANSQLAFHFAADYEAGPWPFTQQWVVEYRQFIFAGTVQKPEDILIQYKKVSGTTYITYWEGTIELRFLTPEVTSFSMHNEEEAAQQGIEEAAGGVRDVTDKFRQLPPVWDYLKKP